MYFLCLLETLNFWDRSSLQSLGSISYRHFATLAIWILLSKSVFFFKLVFSNSISLYDCHQIKNCSSCDPHLCRLWGPTFSSTIFTETGLADAGLNFYLQLIRREHFDISHLTPSLSVCSSNPFSGKSDTNAHSGAKMLEHFVSNVIMSDAPSVMVILWRCGGTEPVVFSLGITWWPGYLPHVKCGAQISSEDVTK